MPTDDLLPGWGTVSTQLTQAQQAAAAGNLTQAAELYQAAMTEIPGIRTGVGLLTQRAEERSVSAIAAAVERTPFGRG